MKGVKRPHIDALTMEAYAAQLVDADSEAAIECHLICCQDCLANVAAASAGNDLPGVESVRLQRIWDAVVDTIDSPPRSLLTLVWSRLRSEWRRFRRFRRSLTLGRTPAGRVMPVARRALVTVVALLTVPVLITVSGSASLFAREPFDSVDHSGPRSPAFVTARALARTSPSVLGALSPCAAGDAWSAGDWLPAVPQQRCAPTDLAWVIDLFCAGHGHHPRPVTNISGPVRLPPTVIDVKPLDSVNEPP